MKADISVLLSVYYKENPRYLAECFNSLLNQTVQAREWVIVKDGSLTKELDEVIERYIDLNPNLIKIVPLSANVGLGLALREGILNCSNDLIARMDTDDVAREDRFELQIKEFNDNLKLDICGSHIIEFEYSIKDTVSTRKVPLVHKEIYKFQKRRSSFNHMTVMYKRKAVLDAGNYEHCPLMEDDMLWVRMMINGACCCNIDDNLVYARVGTDMINRRGGLTYFKKYKAARKKIYNLKFISYTDYLSTLVFQFISACSPLFIRKLIFKKLLRRN